MRRPALRRPVIVSMVNIRIMRVAMHQRLMMMQMSVRMRISHRWILGAVHVLMMLIVNVRVCMIHRHV